MYDLIKRQSGSNEMLYSKRLLEFFSATGVKSNIEIHTRAAYAALSYSISEDINGFVPTASFNINDEILKLFESDKDLLDKQEFSNKFYIFPNSRTTNFPIRLKTTESVTEVKPPFYTEDGYFTFSNRTIMLIYHYTQWKKSCILLVKHSILYQCIHLTEQ